MSHCDWFTWHEGTWSGVPAGEVVGEVAAVVAEVVEEIAEVVEELAEVVRRIAEVPDAGVVSPSA